MSPPIDLLGPDLLWEVFSWCSRYDLLALTLVSVEWHESAQRRLDRHISLTCTKPMYTANVEVLQRLARSASFRSRVCELEIAEWCLEAQPESPRTSWYLSGPPGVISDLWRAGRYFAHDYIGTTYISRASQELLTHVQHALLNLRPKTFTWSALPQIPEILTEAISQQPHCRLDIKRNDKAMDAAMWTYSPITNLATLYRVRKLSSTHLLRLEILLPPHDAPLLHTLGEMLSTSTSLLQLNLYALGKLWGGGKPTHLPKDARTYFKGVNSMEWLAKPLRYSRRKLRLRELVLDNFCCCQVPGFTVADVVDVEEVTKLHLSCGAFVRNLQAMPALRSFRLLACDEYIGNETFCSGSWHESEMRHFLSCCKTIRDLRLHDCESIIDMDLLTQIGGNLSSIVVTGTSPHRSVRTPSATQLSDAELFEKMRANADLIAELCPGLEEYSTNGPKKMSEFHEFLSFLANKLDRLKVLTICRPIEQRLVRELYPKEDEAPDGKDSGINRSITYSNAHVLWSLFRRPAAELTKLILHVGAYAKPWDRELHILGDHCSTHHLRRNNGERTFIISKDLTKEFQSIEDVDVTCVQIDDARFAMRQDLDWFGAASWKDYCECLTERAVTEYRLIPDIPNPLWAQPTFKLRQSDTWILSSY